MKIKKGFEKEYRKYVKLNTKDRYSKEIIKAVESVGVVLDKGKSVEEAEKEMNNYDLTGFMAGMVAQIIARFNPRGEEFRKYWNKMFSDEEVEGIINPAIIKLKVD